MREGLRREKRQVGGVEVEIHFPELGFDHERYGGQVVTVIVPGHEKRPLRYIVGRSRLPEGIKTDTRGGQDKSLDIMMPTIVTDVSEVLAGKEVPAQKMRL